VFFHIPNREREGHGINLAALEEVLAKGVDVLLTCDTGITAHDGVESASEQGVDVIITDHHDLPPTIPRAFAATDPKMLPQTHALRELPGVGVAYKLAQLLYRRAGRAEEAARHLDLAALGIVADVATQTGDVRFLLQRGLDALRDTRRLGLRTLMEIAELDQGGLTEEHIGFELAPRLNALGRLADASPAVEFLTTDDLERARILAHQLDGLNARRKMLCDQVTQAAEAQLERDPSLLDHGALVLSHPRWPGGVIGIVAGRLAERYHRPVILITAPPGELARGSARSIEGCDISAAIAAQAEMLEGFGGHPMAAGLSMNPEKIPAFRRAISRTVRETCQEAISSGPALEIDGYVPLSDLTVDLVEEIERLAPFGPGNPVPTWATCGLSLRHHRTLGRSGEHLKITVEDEGGETRDILWWRADAGDLPKGPFDLAYTVRTRDYRGRRELQIEWIDARPVEKPTPAVERPRAEVTVVDHRGVADPGAVLEELRAETEILVWREGKANPPGVSRDALAPAETLAIWTSPPGGPELRAALERVSPRSVHLFALQPSAGLGHLRGFLTHLARLAKRILASEGGVAEISMLAAGTAQREETVQAGLDWLEAKGHVVVLDERPGVVHLAPGDGAESDRVSSIEGRLRGLLEETRAYRGYVARVDADTLVNRTLAEG
jgi:single-stranded-DNA-specific exonuclease